MASVSSRPLAVLTVVGALLASNMALGGAVPAAEPVPNGPALARQLVQDTDGANAQRHLRALQRIADAGGGNRAAASAGYDASVDYVASTLRAAGYAVSTPSFGYESYEVAAERLTVAGAEVPIATVIYSPSTPANGVTAPILVLPTNAAQGCAAGDYPAATGKIVLIRRGGCTFAQKATAAAQAGAVSVLMANNVAGPVRGFSLGAQGASSIPFVAMTQEDGDALAGANGKPATLTVQAEVVARTSRNVLAQTRTGRTDNVLMAGAHLDSVAEGPGINDNGTGVAALLETARQLGGAPKTRNAVRFAFWGAEELGLLGSNAYVAGLSTEEQLDIAAYLNFDMVGSPNAAYFVYDGDDSDGVGAGAGPFGSAQIEKTFVDFLDFRGVPVEGFDFDGRSDYGAFIARGIPAGGLFTGAEGLKTAAQARKWGGTAGKAYDPCYHTACDNLGNVNARAFNRNLDAIAWAVGKYATSTASLDRSSGVR